MSEHDTSVGSNLQVKSLQQDWPQAGVVTLELVQFLDQRRDATELSRIDTRRKLPCRSSCASATHW